MPGSLMQLAFYASTALAAGAVGGWLVRDALCRRRVAELAADLESRLDDVSRQRDRLLAECAKQRTRLEEQEAGLQQRQVAVSEFRTALESAGEREKRLRQDVFVLRGEREDFKQKLGVIQSALGSVRRQALDLQTEFVKSRDFYKAELKKSFEIRKGLEAKLENARLENESFGNLLTSTRSEHEAFNRLLKSAQCRLADMDNLERDVVRLEAENAQLNHDARLAQREIESLKRDVAELDEFKVQNRELAHCLESMEQSRRQHEEDARRYREQVDQTEQKSETLQIRLDEVEKNFAAIEKQQRTALREARRERAPRPKPAAAPREVDDLQEIVGIGKVFERALHDLGIVSFRQIANFGPADIARVNRELKELKGRLEQDDWIGQARELMFKKYGGADAGRDTPTPLSGVASS